MINIVHLYENKGPFEGESYLVDRLWPRGVKKEDLHITSWIKEIAPTTELRKWFNHEVEKWDDFVKRYTQELDNNQEALKPLIEAAQKGDVTLLYGAKEREHNNAVVLKAYIERILQ